MTKQDRDHRDIWAEKMKDKPCYEPAIPFYDFCLNMDRPIKRYNCDECIAQKGLKDFIE